MYKSDIRLFVLGAVLLVLYNHADYLWQAAVWRWPAWLDLTARADHWPWWADWIPHDGWHIVQTVRSHALLIGAAFLTVAGLRFRSFILWYFSPRWYRVAAWFTDAQWALLLLVAVYGITRALGFTLPLELYR